MIFRFLINHRSLQKRKTGLYKIIMIIISPFIFKNYNCKVAFYLKNMSLLCGPDVRLMFSLLARNDSFSTCDIIVLSLFTPSRLQNPADFSHFLNRRRYIYEK